MNRARERLVRLAKAHGLELRQFPDQVRDKLYVRVGKHALMRYQRYGHAKQFKRANRQLRRLRAILGRVIRDVDRLTRDDERLREVFAMPLHRARVVREQKRCQRGAKTTACMPPRWSASARVCPGLRAGGKAHKPYEFGVKVSVATPVKRSKGGQFVSHVKALPGNPYDGHTLGEVIPEMEALIGNTLERILAAAGYNFRLLLGWLATLLRRILSALLAALMPATAPTSQPKSA